MTSPSIILSTPQTPVRPGRPGRHWFLHSLACRIHTRHGANLVPPASHNWARELAVRQGPGAPTIIKPNHPHAHIMNEGPRPTWVWRPWSRASCKAPHFGDKEADGGTHRSCTHHTTITTASRTTLALGRNPTPPCWHGQAA
ncbi:hypothetical protein ACKKBF_B40830 [Auxenochlorella protothecoides x Auxenochlorella symbiontica]